MGVGVDESAVPKHRANGGFVVFLDHGGSGIRVMNGEVMKRHVVLAYVSENVRVKVEVVRCKIVDVVVIEGGGGGRNRWRY